MHLILKEPSVEDLIELFIAIVKCLLRQNNFSLIVDKAYNLLFSISVKILRVLM